MKHFSPALFAIAAIHAQDLCKQPPPEEMAKAVGVGLPQLPWHVAKGAVHEAGSLRFEGTDFTSWERHSVLVEVGPIFKRDEAGRPHDLTLEVELLPN